ncbi:putative 2,5-diketo-D-gluconic acid reductase A [Pseudomonas fluorescens]|uniref:Putative 2,5-diketo-D-gluconic acid reductase A n=1 Tax=Pseudomonas fluorescens TaxID=294 RepID=A0A0P8WI17_PSEFL|nr:hypothetical protein [Pseudomonas fluorescens]KPU52013.1 putative 2,5-diketo-D-gluconic acid reductase A [Pseudomonas fluorescens]
MQHIVNAQGLNMPKLGLGTWPMLGEKIQVEYRVLLGQSALLRATGQP